jgi:hypothetical protein
LQHPPLSAPSTSAQGLPPRLSPHQHSLQFKLLRRDTVHDVPATYPSTVSTNNIATSMVRGSQVRFQST